MRTGFIFWTGICGVVLSLGLPGTIGAADKKKPAPPPVIGRLAWLSGSWSVEKNGRLIEEQWMTPAGGVMLGMRRAVSKDRVIEHGFFQIREGPGGDLFYIMQSVGRKEAAFQIKSLTETAVVFENPLQDFPQKITYLMQPDRSLLVVTEGVGPDGQPQRIDYAYPKAGR